LCLKINKKQSEYNILNISEQFTTKYHFQIFPCFSPMSAMQEVYFPHAFFINYETICQNAAGKMKAPALAR